MRLKPDPNYFLRDLYRVTGSGLEPDPDYPGMWIITGPGLTPDPDHPGMLLIDPYVGVKDLEPFPVVGNSYLQEFALDVRHPGPASYVDLDLAVVWAQGAVAATLRIRTDLHLDPVRGHSQAHIVADHTLSLDPVRGVSSVSVSMPRPHLEHAFALAFLYGISDVRIQRLPDLSRNSPILLAMSLAARLEALEPLVSQ